MTFLQSKKAFSGLVWILCVLYFGITLKTRAISPSPCFSNDTTNTSTNNPCPTTLPIVQSVRLCQGDSFPTLKASIPSGTTAHWYHQAQGGAALAHDTTAFRLPGIATANDTLYLEIAATNPACTLPRTRIPSYIFVFDCNKSIDLHLKKVVDKKIKSIGDTVIYTVKIWNEGIQTASRVVVSDSLPPASKYISSRASRGNYNPLTQRWEIDSIGIDSDTVSLVIRSQIKVGYEGVWFSQSEVIYSNELDEDSTPNNGNLREDDSDNVCFSIPFRLCPQEKVEVKVPAQYQVTGWYQTDGQGLIEGKEGNTILLETPGTYTFTTQNGHCPTEGCCPIIILPSQNCCFKQMCLPIIVKKKSKP